MTTTTDNYKLHHGFALVLLVIVVTLSVTLSGCSSNTGRYQQAKDSTPTRLPTASELKDAVPRAEPKSRGGNKSRYTVRGKSYQVIDSAVGFKQTGIASWYGNKFHGHLTSNGEIYDMYAMSAAHKNLPLPTYLQVTNLSNNKSVVVRVNDRGPFHENRIIDLSYSAAYKIGMLKTGTAKVSIEAITDFDSFNLRKAIGKSGLQSVAVATPLAKPEEITPIPTNQTSDRSEQTFIQVFATSSKEVAENTASALSNLYQQNVITPLNNGIYRVQMGPFNEQFDTSDIINTLKRSGYPNAYRRKILQ